MRSSSKKKADITQYGLIPKHEIVPLEEAYKLLKEMGVKPEQLPWIKASDPIAKAIGAKPGDIIRIVRNSPFTGKSVSYRYVISG